MILITGHRGFIGSRLMDKLPESCGLDIKDGANLLTCALPLGIDIIYHLAGQTSVVGSWIDPLHDLDNIRITARLIHTYPHAKIIFTSSCAALAPKSPYGFSKKCAMEYISTFHTNYVNLVFPNIYGEGSKSVVDIFKNNENVTIYGDGKQTRDFVHVDDIVEGLLKAKDWSIGTYKMGSGIATSVLELAEGKNIRFADPIIEEREIVVENTTPNWSPKSNVLDYVRS